MKTAPTPIKPIPADKLPKGWKHSSGNQGHIMYYPSEGTDNLTIIIRKPLGEDSYVVKTRTSPKSKFKKYDAYIARKANDVSSATDIALEIITAYENGNFDSEKKFMELTGAKKYKHFLAEPDTKEKVTAKIKEWEKLLKSNNAPDENEYIKKEIKRLKGLYEDGGEIGKIKYILTDYTVSVAEDDYEEGESLETVSNWEIKESKEFDTKQKLIDYMNKVMYVDYKEEHFDWEAGDGKNVQTDVLCSMDAQGDFSPATKDEKELWKKGEQKLYNCHYWFYVLPVIVQDKYEKGGEIHGSDLSEYFPLL